MIQRQPTLDEAVAWILSARTVEYQRVQIAAWADEYGAQWADMVRAACRARIKSQGI